MALWQLLPEDSNSIVALQGVSNRLSVQTVQAHVGRKMLTHPGHSSEGVPFRTRMHIGVRVGRVGFGVRTPSTCFVLPL